MTIHCDKCGNRVERWKEPSVNKQEDIDNSELNYAVLIERTDYEQMEDTKVGETITHILCKACDKELFGGITKR